MPKDISNLNPNRILAMQLRQIGDVVLSTPSIRLIKQRFPSAELDVLTEDRCAPVFENNPHVSKVWLIRKKELKNPLKALAYYRRVGRGGYDLIIDFQQLPRCRYVTMFSRAPVKLTMTPPWYNRLLYTHWTDPLEGYAAMCKAGVLRPLGITWNNERPEIFLTGAEKKWADDFLAAMGLLPEHTFITVDSTHRRATRRWPAKHWGHLLKALYEKNPGLRFYLMYGPGEEDFAREVFDTAEGKGCLMPETVRSLREVMAVISKAKLHLGTCSAPRHFATGLDVPTLTVLGSSSWGWTRPSPEHTDIALGLDCQPCGNETCQYERIKCMTDFTPDMVLPKVLEKLATPQET